LVPVFERAPALVAPDATDLEVVTVDSEAIIWWSR